jgi:hypothetical protein
MSRVDAAGLVDRLRAASELYECGLAMMEQRIRREHPTASDAEVAHLLLDWRLRRADAPEGDGVGRLVPCPRPRP